MVGPISSSSQAQRVVEPSTPPAHKPTKSDTKSAPAKDTVHLSQAAQAMAAAAKEATETAAQTAQEANSGDPQAQKLRAIEAVR